MADKLLGIRPPSRSWQVGAAYRDRILVLSSIPDDTYEASGLYHSYVTTDMFASTTGTGFDGDSLGISSSSDMSYTVVAADGWGYTSADELAKQYMAEPVIRIGANRLDEDDDEECEECDNDAIYSGDGDDSGDSSSSDSDKNDRTWYDARRTAKHISKNSSSSSTKGQNYDFIDSFVSKYNIHSLDDETPATSFLPSQLDLDRPNCTSSSSPSKNQHPLTSPASSNTTSTPTNTVKNKDYSQLSMLTYLSKIASNPTTSLAPSSSSSLTTSSTTDITHLADSVLFQYAGSNSRANKLRYMPLYQDVDWSMSDVERHDDVSRAVGDWLDMLPVMGYI